MSQKTSDQGWQRLQSAIEDFFEHALRSDKQQIEYRPRFIVELLETPSERNQNELRD